MVKLTMIARVTDGLPLAEGLDDGRDLQDAEVYKQQVKALFKNLSRGQNEASRMSIETGPYIFQYPWHWLLGILLPRFLILLYVQGVGRHLAVATYFLIVSHHKTKKLYQDTRTQRNIAKLNDELYEVHQIMTRNVQEVLGVGEKLDQVSQMSSRLTSESRIYADKAKDLNRQALIRKWAPVAIVLGVVFLLFWVKKQIW
ncbi:synaptobrevin family protein [Actinidia rufa]|uniref:Synaptobrevin family protein n=1 Tax=Actinidia rufa TaxID=165716 RepID=A0A7J0GLF5_9ERIC|nr:synaptobrevin family protein [Actinidia rufa]